MSSTNCDTLLVLRAKARKPRNVREWHGCLGQYHNTTIGMAGALIDGPIDTKWLQPDFDLPQHRYFFAGRVCPFWGYTTGSRHGSAGIIQRTAGIVTVT